MYGCQYCTSYYKWSHSDLESLQDEQWAPLVVPVFGSHVCEVLGVRMGVVAGTLVQQYKASGVVAR